MNIIEIGKKYNTDAKCREYLESLRWGKTVLCTKCGSDNVVDLKRENGRYHCNHCKTTFSVISDTMFEHSGLPLSKWFMLVGLMLNSKTAISSKELERNIGVTYKTAWYCAMRVRCTMIDHCNIELTNVVEMDEAYMGGKPRKHYSSDNPNLPTIGEQSIVNKRGRGTRKIPVVGIVERGDNIVLKVIEKLTSRNLIAMLKEYVKLDSSIVVTDEFKSYKSFDDIVQHYTINHSKKQWVKGMMHTNTIEGFWSIVKNSIKGNYRAISPKYLPFYLVQSQYIYNHRNYKGNLFEKFLKQALTTDRSEFMEDYKPVTEVKKLVYKQCKK
jgi:transposase-like protein